MADGRFSQKLKKKLKDEIKKVAWGLFFLLLEGEGLMPLYFIAICESGCLRDHLRRRKKRSSKFSK